jgi:hypothetical protein
VLVQPCERLTVAEAAALTPVCLLASLVVGGWLGDLAGLSVQPATSASIAAAAAVPCGVALWRRARADTGGLVLWGAVAGTTLALLLWWAWPTLLPLGSGPDLVHHLALIKYIESNRSLVHDPAAERWLGEMVAYTPGSHLLAALGGQMSGLSGLRVLHALVALAVALKAGLVALIAVRAARTTGPAKMAVGAAAALFLFLPRDYTLGSFAHDSYVAQVVAETFAVAMWWAIPCGGARPSAARLAVFALCGTAAFLTWPVWIGALLLAFAVVTGTEAAWPVRDRVLALAAGCGPAVAVASVHVVGRLGWVGIAGTSGAVRSPSLAGIGPTLALLGGAGLLLAGRDLLLRPTVAVLLATALQAAALLALATAHGAHTPYMAYKMAYLAVAPLAVLGAVAVERAASLAARAARLAPAAQALVTAAALALTVALAGIGVARAEAKAPSPRPAVTMPLLQAAQWLRGQGTTGCVDYLTDSWVSAYWLHVVELGHPRLARRTQEITDRFDRRAVIGRWIDPAGDYRLAIVEDMEQLPRDARADNDTIARFGPAGIMRRQRPAPCPDPMEPPPR